MRKLTKTEIPAVLTQNQEAWTREFEASPGNETARRRYTDPAIKRALMNETNDKCVYCESKVGHNTFGDTEHKVPTAVNRALHFQWTNLTIACSVCNQRKGALYDPAAPILDPYVDDVEELLVHNGPIVNGLPGNYRAEITVTTFQLNYPKKRSAPGVKREKLLLRKVEHITYINDLIQRIAAETPGLRKELLKEQLESMMDIGAEFSAMVISIVNHPSNRAILNPA